jgi:hypothetical protein
MSMARATVRLVARSALALLAAAPAFADCFGYFCRGQIQDMTVTADAVYVRLQNGTTGLTNCTPYAQHYFTLHRDNPNYSSFYATLMAAYMAKESVTLRPVDASANCVLSYIAVP